MFSFFPDHAFCGAACRPRPYEKESCHGTPPISAARRLIASRFTVASPSDWPPERNTMPGTIAGTELRKQWSVYRATVSAGARSRAGGDGGAVHAPLLPE